MVAGEEVIARGEGGGAKLTVEIGRAGEPVIVAAEVTDARSAAVAELIKRLDATAGPTALKASMPGRVVKVLVKVGDKLAVGQPAVVGEAMKMGDEARGPRAGAVRELRCAEGGAGGAGRGPVGVRVGAARAPAHCPR